MHQPLVPMRSLACPGYPTRMKLDQGPKRAEIIETSAKLMSPGNYSETSCPRPTRREHLHESLKKYRAQLCNLGETRAGTDFFWGRCPHAPALARADRGRGLSARWDVARALASRFVSGRLSATFSRGRARARAGCVVGGRLPAEAAPEITRTEVAPGAAEDQP